MGLFLASVNKNNATLREGGGHVMGVPLLCVGRVEVLLDTEVDHRLVVCCSKARTRPTLGFPGVRVSARAIVQLKRFKFMEASYVKGR